MVKSVEIGNEVLHLWWMSHGTRSIHKVHLIWLDNIERRTGEEDQRGDEWKPIKIPWGELGLYSEIDPASSPSRTSLRTSITTQSAFISPLLFLSSSIAISHISNPEDKDIGEQALGAMVQASIRVSKEA
jgi:hypothetical protein